VIAVITFVLAGPEDRDDSERRDDQRKGHHDVEHTLQVKIKAAAEISAADAEHEAGHSQ